MTETELDQLKAHWFALGYEAGKKDANYARGFENWIRDGFLADDYEKKGILYRTFPEES